tara:strand:- start:764 stop:1855 length:1092 start_codon:yes stop_codon:yes gene_type:complete
MIGFKRIAFLIALAIVAYSLNSLNVEAAGAPPPNPTIYTGSITVGGQTPPDSEFVLEGVRKRCLEGCITARIGSFVSDGGIVENGSYVLTVGPPDATLVNSAITFHYDAIVKADQEDLFLIYPTIRTVSSYNLTFPALPAATPTPLPVLAPSETAPQEDTVEDQNPVVILPANPVVATDSSIPVVSANNLYLSISGEIAITSSDYADGSIELLAKVGSYFSDPVTIMGYAKEKGTTFAVFNSLILEPSSSKFIGRSIDFYIRFSDGSSKEVKIVGNPLVFGETLSDIEIELEAEGSNNPPSTSLLPEDKQDSSDSDNALVAEDSSGTCGRVESVSLLQGSGDMMMMLAPILFLVGYTGWRKRK